MKRLLIMALAICGMLLAHQPASRAGDDGTEKPAPPATAVAASPQPGDADFPTPSPSERHNQKVTAVRSGQYDLALIGDSITHTMGELGGKYEALKAVWDKYFAPRRAINLGHNGYRTENILWNLQNGELDFAQSPKAMVLLIGTNNTDDRHYRTVHTPEQILAGTRAIVNLIRQRHPTTKILILRIFPRGGDAEAGTGRDIFHASEQCLDACRRAGELTRQLADGQHVFWLDINHVFLRPDGRINTDLMPDLLHPNAAGAEVWARAIQPTLTKLMGEPLLPVSQPATAGPQRLPLWKDQAPLGGGEDESANAFLTIFRAPKPNGAAAIICPGGGYGGLVTGAEGSGIAKWLNEHGITGIVLEYRLPAGRAFVPLFDVQRAMRTVRTRAREWDIDPARIGIIGFSAGGHLAATAATRFDAGNVAEEDPVKHASSRPDFAILVYPVITMGPLGHGGSKKNLLGPAPETDLEDFFSNEKHVTDQNPPTFLTHAKDDRVVSPENSRLFHEALVAHQVPAKYLELPSGDHGLNGYKGPMWEAWQTQSLQWLASLKIIPAADAPAEAFPADARAFPTFQSLAAGPLQTRLLPGQDQFVFSMYGTPGELGKIQQLVAVMRDQHLGNGFDPGPGPHPGATPIFEYLTTLRWPIVFYSGGEMQIKGGRSVFGLEQETMLAPLDRAGIFTAYQLGEWGYYFHNLAPRESWWRDVYGQDFEAYKHLMKPKGLAGYDRLPATRQECYDILKDYFQSRSRDLLGRVMSVTGHSHYEAYVGEWGARCIGLELGENIAFTQSKLAFARGASRQWQKPWSVQVSPWFNGSCTTSGPLRTEGGGARGLDAGHSLSFYERMWLHSWFAGAAMVTPENSVAIFFEKQEAPWTLTSHGRKAAEVFQFMRDHPRGVPYTPVAVVLDHLAGYNGYMDKPWGILPPAAGDREIRDLFDHQLYPGSDHIHARPDPENPEGSYLRPTPYGEIFDVLLTSVPPEILPSYPVLLLAGDIRFEPAFLGELEKALRRGSRVLLAPRHREALGPEFARLTRQGKVEVLEPWTNPATGRPAAVSHARLVQVVKEELPFEISGDPVQFQVNRTPSGWVVEFINNRGVAKKPAQPAFTDPGAVAWIQVYPKANYASVREWRSGREHRPGELLNLEIGPGAVEYLEFKE